MSELLEGLEFFRVRDDSDVGEDDSDCEFQDDLSAGFGTSMGRKKGSWLACTYFRQRKVEKAVCRMSTIEI